MTVFDGEPRLVEAQRVLNTRTWRRDADLPAVSIRGRSCGFCLPLRFCVAALLSVGLLTAPILGAQSRCTIELEVNDGLSEKLEGVDVRLDGPALFKVRSLVTGPDGLAVLLGIPAGTYQLEISRQGFQWLEISDVRCQPAGVVRLPVVLERTEGDEVVILPSGPSVDPEATTVGRLLSRSAWELLPQGRVDSLADPARLQIDALAFAGIVQAGHLHAAGLQMLAVPRQPERGLRGRLSIEAGAGARARPTGTRAAVERLEDVWRTRFSIGGIPADSTLGTMLALEVGAADLEGQVAFSNSASGESVDRQRSWDQDTVLAYGVLDWMLKQNQRLDLRLNWRRQGHEGVASTLHVAPDQPLPGGDRTQQYRRVGLQWDALVSPSLALRIAGGYSDSSLEWTPSNDGLMVQDQSPNGSWSGGLGNGVWGGDGGVAGFNQGVEDLHGTVGLEWEAGSGHRLGFEGSWHREDLDLRYSQRGEGVGLGIRRFYRGPVAERWDTLASSGASRGLSDSRRVLMQDTWRATADLTVVLGLEMRDIQFNSGEEGPGYRFGIEDTVSPRVGLVWDFEGTGRSRAWVRWARFRHGPGKAVQFRLAGALDVETIFVDDDGSQHLRLPGPVEVAGDLEPTVVDETVVGIEYEILSHLFAGVAGASTRSRGGLAILTQDGGSTFVLNTPLGDDWPDRLDSERLESWGWVRKRLANGWQAELLVGWRRSQGTMPLASNIDLTDIDREYLSDVLSPVALEGARGALPDDRRWHFLASGSWRFAAGPSLGGRLTYRSGAPISQLGALADGLGLDRRFVGNRGSAGRTPELWRLDLIASWPFEVGAGEFEAFIDISNLLDSQQAVIIDERWTVVDETQISNLEVDGQETQGTWGEPLAKQRPLELRLGLAFRW